MRLHILTVGSRGDIEPLTALGAGLRRAGHHVTVVSNSEGRTATECAGLAFHDLRFSVRDLLRSHAGSSMLHGGSAHHSRIALIDAATAATPAVAPRIIDACADADGIISTETVHLLARSIAEWRRAPHIAASFAPYGRTRAYRSFYADVPELRTASNQETHGLVQRYHHSRFLPAVNALRTNRLGLPPITLDDADAGREACPAILGYSPAVAPPPDDWPAHRHVTGYWRTGDDAEPVDRALVDFVEDGDPPLYVGFGSMPYDAPAIAALLDRVTLRTGVRIVYATGWADSAGVGARSGVFITRGVSHRWLLPRVLGAVHHGGAGTTGAAVMAGVPSLVAWLIVDQVFWAQRVADLGVGMDLGPFDGLTEDILCDAVRRLQESSRWRERAQALATTVANENGVAAGVAAIQRYLAASPPELADGLSRSISC